MQSHYIFPTMITPYSENGALDYETAENTLNGITAAAATAYLPYASPAKYSTYPLRNASS